MTRPSLKKQKTAPSKALVTKRPPKSSAHAAPPPQDDPDPVDPDMMHLDADDDLPYDEPPDDVAPSTKPPRPQSSDVDLLPPRAESWRHPPAPSLNPAKHDLTIMQTDSFVPTTTLPAAPAVIHLFGLTESGNSALLRVHNFFPYFYAQAVRGVSATALREALSDQLVKNNIAEKSSLAVRDVQLVTKRNVLYFVPGDPHLQFFKITLTNPRLMRDVSSILQRGGFTAGGIGIPELLTFEATLDGLLRFMIEHGLSGCSWITLPKGTYKVAQRANHRSHLQYEVDVDACDLIAHRTEGKWLSSAPMRRLSFDIECAGRKGVFPEPQHDSVIQIANYVWDYGRDKPAVQVVFTLKSCAPIVGVEVLSFESEEHMLAAWSRFIRLVDPDIVTGYNIVNFDLPYLLDRAEELKVQDFPFLGRMIGQPTRMRRTRMSSSAFGTHESKAFTMHGRIIFDMLQLVTREYKLRSYSLNSVSAEFLGQQKEDVHYSIISDLQRGDEQTRRRLAVYCLKDALLPLRLMDKLMSLTNYIEMARVTGIPLGWLVSRGHMVKVVSLLHRKSHDVNLLIPDVKKQAPVGDGEGGPQFEGATVIEPIRGYYKEPIATLDFASLYPSIIMAHNLCYSTLVRPQDRARMDPKDMSTTPTGATFVKKEVKKGILTEMLEELLSARKQAKKDLKEETDPFKKSVLNARQLALKISANAVYGFTGAQVGKLPCMDISASTTAYGRQMIENTKAEVEERYKSATVIYGDTDSVMIKFGSNLSLGESMKLGEEAAEAISQIFPKPVKLEFEKCYYPYLLISKKRYAGLLWTNTEKYDKMDCKGIEAVRRDNCRLVANVISSVLELLMKQKDLKRAISMVKGVISDLLQNKIDISLLVVSKALSKVDYDNKQAHVELARKLKQRDPGTAPALGDRVPYVITKGVKNEPAYSRAEDPLFVLENNLPIDNNYYLENMLRKPLERIFEPLMPTTVNSLFVGEHTRSISVVTPKTGGMMKFAKKRLTCLGCKTAIKSGAICQYCVPREAELYLKHLDGVKKVETVYSALWTECQRCMGEICHDVLCSNGDCPIFYRRRKAQKDLDEATTKLSRFDVEW